MAYVLLRSLLLTIPLCFAWTAILVSISFLLMPFHRERALTWLWHFWGRSMLFLCGAKARVTGLENIDPKQHYIFVSNHLSLIDSPLLVSYIPQALCFLAKRELF